MDVIFTTSKISAAPAATLAAEPSPATPESDELRRRILDEVLKLSQPVPPPAAWARFGSHKSLRRLCCEPQELLSHLSRQFTAEELVAARVALRTKAGELEIATALATKQSFLIRRDATGHAPGDVVGQRGQLSGGGSEWRHLAAQPSDANSAHATPIILGASDAELCVLVRLGIPCSPLAGADQLSGKQVRALFNKRSQDGAQCRYQLVLLGWQPDILSSEPSAKNLAAIQHVAAIEPTYGFDPQTMFSVWLPGRVELTRIRRAHSFADRELVAAEFKASLRKSLYAPGDALTLLADRAPATWARHRASLELNIERSRIAPRASEASVALSKLELAFRNQVLRPLETAAGTSGLPAMLSFAAAELAQQWLEELELVQAARRVIAGQFPGCRKRLDDATLNRKLRLVSTFVKLASVKFKTTANCRSSS